MNSIPMRTIDVDHLVNLDGFDGGAATIVIGPAGIIESVVPRALDERPGSPCRTLIPLLADAHAHLGISNGLVDTPDAHTIEHVDNQLSHLAHRGVGHIHSLGTDQRWLQDRLRARVMAREPADRAYGYSAGIGFGAVGGWPPDLTFPEHRFRPVTPHSARAQVVELAKLGCRTLKIWVDDFGGKVPKVPLDVMRAILEEARECAITTFAHVHFHEDAQALVKLGVGVLAHSVRDKIMDAALLDDMAKNDVALVPTLSREEAEIAFSMDENPYMSNPFFLKSEARLVTKLRDRKFSDDPGKPSTRLQMAQQNLARAYESGIAIGMGTDSGFKMKLLGFAQHRELELMRDSGMSASACLKSALGVNKDLFANALSPIADGEPASFFIVDGNPFDDISATQNIRDIWVAGKALSVN